MTRLRRAFGGIVLMFAVGSATADPAPPGEDPAMPDSKPGAAVLGAGTIFLTRVAIQSSGAGVVYLSQGQQLPRLDQPVGSCRLQARTPGTAIPAGTPLTVATVASTTAPYTDRGISSVTWTFDPADPATSLVCDTVGSNGPSQGDVEMEIQGILKIEPTRTLD